MKIGNDRTFYQLLGPGNTYSIIIFYFWLAIDLFSLLYSTIINQHSVALEILPISQF